ncbi:MAG: phosphatase PAP2 family protein, partial [Ilumatobacteraceae bacterium]
IIISTIVHRSRPDVERLLTSPVDTSFPSGHVAAATVYIALAVIVFWHTRSVVARTVAVVICLLLPIMVGAGRMYEGMHFFTDVVGGVILGIVSLVLCYRVLGPPADAVTGTN